MSFCIEGVLTTATANQAPANIKLLLADAESGFAVGALGDAAHGWLALGSRYAGPAIFLRCGDEIEPGTINTHYFVNLLR